MIEFIIENKEPIGVILGLLLTLAGNIVALAKKTKWGKAYKEALDVATSAIEALKGSDSCEEAKASVKLREPGMTPAARAALHASIGECSQEKKR